MNPNDYPHESSAYFSALDQQEAGPCRRSIAAYVTIDGKSVRIPLSQDAYGFIDSAEEAELRRLDEAARAIDEFSAEYQDRERNQ